MNYCCLLLEDVNRLTASKFNLLITKAKEIAFNFKNQINFSDFQILNNVVKNFLTALFNLFLNTIENAFEIIIFFLTLIFIFSGVKNLLSVLLGSFIFSVVSSFIVKFPTFFVSIKNTIKKWREREKNASTEKVSVRKTKIFLKNVFVISVCLMIALFLWKKLPKKYTKITNNSKNLSTICLFLIFVILRPITAYISISNFMLFIHRKKIPLKKLFSKNLPKNFKQGLYTAYTTVRKKYQSIIDNMKIYFVLILEKGLFPNMSVLYTSSNIYLFLMDDPQDLFINKLTANEIESIYLHEFGHFLEGYYNNNELLFRSNKFLFLNMIIPLISALFNPFYALVYALLIDIYLSTKSVTEEVKADIFSILNLSQKEAAKNALKKMEMHIIEKIKRLENKNLSLSYIKRFFGEVSHPNLYARIKYLQKLEKMLEKTKI